jgi:hypothetical protein
MKKINLVTFALSLYLVTISIYAYPKVGVDVSCGEYIGVIVVTTLIILFLRILQIRKYNSKK